MAILAAKTNPWLLCLTGLLWFGGVGARAESGQVPFRLIDQSSGLPSGEIFALEQGADGFIYIATEYGLARYDGVDIRVLRSRPGNDLPQHNFQELYRDRKGRLWASSGRSGLMRLGAEPSIMARWDRSSSNNSLPANDVWAIEQACDGRLLLGYLGHVPTRFDPAARGEKADRIILKDGHEVTFDILVDRNCRIWIASLGGLRVISSPEYGGRAAWMDEIETIVAGSPVYGVSEGPDGTIRVVSRRGLYRVGAGGVRRIDAGWDRRRVGSARVVHETRMGDLWVGTSRGLVLVGRQEGTPRFFAAGPDGPLPAPVTEAILEDHEGGLWFATRGGGVAYLPTGWKRFQRLSLPEAEESIAAVTQAPGGRDAPLMVATGDGRILAATALERVGVEGHLRDDEGDPLEAAALLALPDGGWVSSDGATVFHHAAGGRVSRLVGVGDEALSGASGRFIEFSLAGEGGRGVWVGTLGMGLIRVDIDSGEVAHWHRSADAGRRFPARHSMVLYQHQHDGLWVGTERGVHRMSRDGRIEPVPGLSRRIIHDMSLEGDRLWLADDQGVHAYRRVDGGIERIQSFTSGRTLPDTDVVALTRDADGNLWLASAAGLVRLDPDNGDVRTYGAQDGLSSSQFLPRGLVRRGGGEIWAVTLDGVFRFRPGEMVRNTVAPALHWTGLSTPDGRLKIPAGGSLELDWNDLPLMVDFAATTFDAPSRVPYRLRLRGWDRDWIDLTGQRQHIYTRIDPGRYTLQLNAANPDGVWNEAGISLGLSVRPPWWRTGSAYLVYAVVIGTALLWGLRIWMRTRRRRVQLEAARQASTAKSDFLARMSHEIRTPLHGVMGMLHMLRRDGLSAEQRSVLGTVDRSGRQLQRILDDILDLSAIEAGQVEFRHEWFDLRQVLDQAVELHAQAAGTKALDVTLLTSCELPRAVRGDAVRLGQILGNLLSNAIKFTDHGRVQIEAWRGAPGWLCLQVTDTGPGMTPAQRRRLFQPYTRLEAEKMRKAGGTGLGLSICRQLVELQGGSIRVTSETGRGSRFSVDLPLIPGPDHDTASPLAGREIRVAAAPWQVRALRRMLAPWGMTVRRARGGRLAGSPCAVVVAYDRLAGPLPDTVPAGGFVVLDAPEGLRLPPGTQRVCGPLTETRLLPYLLDCVPGLAGE